MIGAPFRVDPDASRNVTFVDLLYACLAAFVVVPALAFGAGMIWVWLLPDALALPGDLLLSLGFSGLFAWIGVPVAVLFGRVAARRGWIGWGFALVAGLASGLAIGALTLAIDGAFYSAAFVPLLIAIAAFGAGYAALVWAALRWLRPGAFR